MGPQWLPVRFLVNANILICRYSSQGDIYVHSVSYLSLPVILNVAFLREYIMSRFRNRPEVYLRENDVIGTLKPY